MFKIIMIIIGLVLAIGLIAVTIFVEREAGFRHETITAQGQKKALVLYHPSRDAGFSDELSLAVADGFKAAGLAVDRQTMTSETPHRPKGYAVIAVVSNTFFASPDWPTLRYLGRADLKGISVIGLMCGSGSTDRAERKLAASLRRTGAIVIGTRHFWISRPNDEARMNESNRQVAWDMARKFGAETGQGLLEDSSIPAAASAR